METETTTKSSLNKYFSCGCRTWCIMPGDETGVKEQPPNTKEDHCCEKITVWRTDRGIKRFFKKNI